VRVAEGPRAGSECRAPGHRGFTIPPHSLMARLTRCPSCNHEVSSQAGACPQCGHQFKSAGSINLRDPVHFIGVLIAVLMVAWIVSILMQLFY
jgi:predicted amidophosphoribosyltransferase